MADIINIVNPCPYVVKHAQFRVGHLAVCSTRYQYSSSYMKIITNAKGCVVEFMSGTTFLIFHQHCAHVSPSHLDEFNSIEAKYVFAAKITLAYVSRCIFISTYDARGLAICIIFYGSVVKRSPN